MLKPVLLTDSFQHMPPLLRHVTKSDVKYIKLHYAHRKGGKSVLVLSKELGLCEKRVARVVNQLGLKGKAKVWQPHECSFIREHNDSMSTQQLADSLGVEPKQINAKRTQLGLTIPPLWTDEKLDYLKAQPLHRSYAEIAQEIGLPKHCVSRMAVVLGLQREATNWSVSEDDTLRLHHATMCSEELAKLIGRSRQAINHRASVLKLGQDYDEIHFRQRQLSVDSLSDRYIAKHMARCNPALQNTLLHYPDLLMIRKQEIILNRTIKYVSQPA